MGDIDTTNDSRVCHSVASNLEIAVIATAYILSGLLVTGTWRRGWYHDPTVELIWTTVLVIAGISLAGTSLFLAFMNKVTLDAMAAASIGFLPAAQALREISWNRLLARYMMSKRLSLTRRKGKVMYARMGNPHGARNFPEGKCYKRRDPCHLELYVRVESDDYLTQYERLWRATFTARRDAKKWDAPAREEYWHGREIGECTKNVVVVIKDNRNGDAFVARNKILRATQVVEFPPNVYMVSKEEALNALTVAADIVMIGDLCLYFFKKQLQIEYEYSKSMKHAKFRTPAMICNRLFDELKLQAWGKISPEDEMFPEDNERGKQYAAIFFILSVRSKIFSRVKNHGTAAVTILDKCYNQQYGTDQESLKADVKEWMEVFGFDFCKPRLRELDV